ncbi:hypothetical protein TNCV_1116591 [Trichonephila clavipes]|nr:hypothetical protein TNCV_1116591 [Trichonephila clavipes]
MQVVGVTTVDHAKPSQRVDETQESRGSRIRRVHSAPTPLASIQRCYSSTFSAKKTIRSDDRAGLRSRRCAYH